MNHQTCNSYTRTNISRKRVFNSNDSRLSVERRRRASPRYRMNANRRIFIRFTAIRCIRVDLRVNLHRKHLRIHSILSGGYSLGLESKWSQNRFQKWNVLTETSHTEYVPSIKVPVHFPYFAFTIQRREMTQCDAVPHRKCTSATILYRVNSISSEKNKAFLVIHRRFSPRYRRRQFAFGRFARRVFRSLSLSLYFEETQINTIDRARSTDGC